jgi:hypothetical protein
VGQTPGSAADALVGPPFERWQKPDQGGPARTEASAPHREIESLTDYILVAQDQIRIEQYTRGDAIAWAFRDYQRVKDVLRIASIGVSQPLAAIYERIEFLAET